MFCLWVKNSELEKYLFILTNLIIRGIAKASIKSSDMYQYWMANTNAATTTKKTKKKAISSSVESSESDAPFCWQIADTRGRRARILENNWKFDQTFEREVTYQWPPKLSESRGLGLFTICGPTPS